MVQTRELPFRWLGFQSYSQALREQELEVQRLHQAVRSLESQDESGRLYGIVLGVEHQAVITLGKRASRKQDIPSDNLLPGIELVQCERGGQATFHGPGQLVIYPILNLRSFGMGVRSYVEILESATIQGLSSFGISARRGSQAGVFTDRGKIAFIGIRVHRGISYHGLSVNISNDLRLFKQIRSCGITGGNFDKLDNYQPGVELYSFFCLWVRQLEKHLFL